LWGYLATHLSNPLWQTIPLIIIAAGLLVRSFIIFHDCGHMSFFKSRRANEWVGMATGLLAFTCYHHWRWEHSGHHSTVGDLDKRGIGDMWTMTTKEYAESSKGVKFGYRIVRNPYFLFGFVPLFLFLVKQRFPAPQAKRSEHIAVHLTSVAVVIVSVLLSFAFGWKEYMIVQGSILTLAATGGSWLFYVQHQYEDTYWQRNEDWDYYTSALMGSSYYKLPRVLQFFSGNIGFHHIHHLNSKIPNYNLEGCQKNLPFLQSAKTIGLWDGFKTARLALWDEDQKKMITFKEIKDVTYSSSPNFDLTA
jgi:omega-6 fatty acid desaturase (delta-12 desaturase)